MLRLSVLVAHLHASARDAPAHARAAAQNPEPSARDPAWAHQAGSIVAPAPCLGAESPRPTSADAAGARLEDRGQAWTDLSGLKRLPGPHALAPPRRPATKIEALRAASEWDRRAQNVIYLERLARELCGDTAVNLVVPMVVFARKPYVDDVVVLGNPKDATRVARLHLVKSTLYGEGQMFLGDGVLPTRNLDAWREQRTELVEGLLPLASLAKIMPVSVERARYAVEERLVQWRSPHDGKIRVDAHEFFLFEAMTQLHLALFGESREFSEANNVKLRVCFDAQLKGPFVGETSRIRETRDFIREFSTQVLRRSQDERGKPTHAAPFRAAATGCPVQGPVAAKLLELSPPSAVDPVSVRRDSTTVLSFAGFDTTANMMTWAVFSLAQRPHLQRRLQAEIDALARELAAANGGAGRAIAYDDLPKLPFMTRVINETLRLWTSVPNGTFRELSYDEWVEAEDGVGGRVLLKAGTQVWLPTWLLHRSEKLWGPDALEFNPDREFSPEELWGGRPFAAWNPASVRFTPFVTGHRGCLGLNFAQMESRVILFHLFRDFDVELDAAVAGVAGDAHLPTEAFLGENRGTMGPRGGMPVVLTKRGVRT